jgi:hypothetical protein
VAKACRDDGYGEYKRIVNDTIYVPVISRSSGTVVGIQRKIRQSTVLFKSPQFDNIFDMEEDSNHDIEYMDDLWYEIFLDAFSPSDPASEPYSSTLQVPCLPEPTCASPVETTLKSPPIDTLNEAFTQFDSVEVNAPTATPIYDLEEEISDPEIFH